MARFGSDKVQEGNEEVIPWKTPYILSISQNDETATDLKREAAAVYFVIVSTQIDRLGRVITYLGPRGIVRGGQMPLPNQRT